MFILTFRINSLASIVKYAGKINFAFMILSIVRLRSSDVNGGWINIEWYYYRKKKLQRHTAPVSISYINAPNDHLRITIERFSINFILTKQTNQQLYHDHYELKFQVPYIQLYHKMYWFVRHHKPILYINRNQLI